MKLLVIGKEGKIAKYINDPAVYGQYDIVYVENGTPDEDILAVGKDADFILADAIAKVSGNVISQMPNLKMIHSEGVAFNGIDTETAKEKHVYVCNCKGMNATAVGEQAILLMLGLLRDVVNGNTAVHEGKQIETKEGYMVRGDLKELADCKIGFVGFGDIAKATAKMAAVFGAEIAYYDIFRAKPEMEEAYGVTFMELDELLADCDIISIHLPVTPGTLHMVNKDFLSKMKEGAYFINTARGDLVEWEALLDAIRSGHIAGAGLDTVEGEPVAKDNPMLTAEKEVEDKIIYSCHIGGITSSSFKRGYEMVFADMQKMIDGQEPDHIVNRW